MIPDFPQFKSIEISDKEIVDSITSKYPPYSDFNFISMWSWDVNNEMKISKLNDNLVVFFSDYVSGKHFLSFIGQNKIKETTTELLKFSKKNYGSGLLKLIPEEIANALIGEFNLKLDVDSFDYIFSIKNLINMDTWPNHTSGQKIRNFLKSYPDYVVKVQNISEINNIDYINLFENWAKNKNIENPLELNEFKAFKRFLQITDTNMGVISLYLKDSLIGFSMYEIISGEYAISHFIKANTKEYNSVYDILNWEEAKILDSKGVKYYNWEQDLGIQGLKFSKEKYKPSFYFKKYIVQNKSFKNTLYNIINHIKS